MNNNLAVQDKNVGAIQQAPKKSLVEKFLTMVVDYAQTSQEQLDQKTKTLAVDIITGVNKTLKGQNITWDKVDISGCGFVGQIKRWAKLGLTTEDKLYVDIRNNKNTGLKDITIKPQYQTIEKLMVRYFSKPLIRFKEDIICIGDEVYEEEDFNTGLSRIVGHKRNMEIDRNKIENITGAYKIAYVKEKVNGEDTLVQYVVRIDKSRIDRAYTASPSNDKSVWLADTRKMVLKTVTWEMWNDKNIRAFMVFPEDIVQDLSVIEESQQMNWNAETQYQSVDQVQNKVEEKVASEDIIDVDFEGDNA